MMSEAKIIPLSAFRNGRTRCCESPLPSGERACPGLDPGSTCARTCATPRDEVPGGRVRGNEPIERFAPPSPQRSPAKPGLARVSQYGAQVGQARLAWGEGAGRARGCVYSSGKSSNGSRAVARASIKLLVGGLRDLEEPLAVGRPAHHEADVAVDPVHRRDLSGDVVVQRRLRRGRTGAIE